MVFFLVNAFYKFPHRATQLNRPRLRLAHLKLIIWGDASMHELSSSGVSCPRKHSCGRIFLSHKPNALSNSSALSLASLAVMPKYPAWLIKISCAVSNCIKLNSWGTIPKIASPLQGFDQINTKNFYSPSRRGNKELIILMVVDLPAPLGPSKAKKLPCGTVKSIPLEQ